MFAQYNTPPYLTSPLSSSYLCISSPLLTVKRTLVLIPYRDVAQCTRRRPPRDLVDRAEEHQQFVHALRRCDRRVHVCRGAQAGNA